MAWQKKKEPLSYEQALAYCLRLLHQRSYSEHGMRQKLTQHATEPAEQDAVITRLKALNLINDARYAQSLVRTEATYRKSSTRKISQKLLTKGIDRELIESSLQPNQEALPSDTERAIHHAEKFLTKERRKLGESATIPLELKQKLFAHLSRKGFAYATIKEAVERALQLHRKNV